MVDKPEEFVPVTGVIFLHTAIGTFLDFEERRFFVPQFLTSTWLRRYAPGEVVTLQVLRSYAQPLVSKSHGPRNTVESLVCHHETHSASKRGRCNEKEGGALLICPSALVGVKESVTATDNRSARRLWDEPLTSRS